MDVPMKKWKKKDQKRRQSEQPIEIGSGEGYKEEEFL